MTGEADDSTRTARSQPRQLDPGTVLAGRFRVEELLGVGGMGMVYRATDLDLDTPVALKLLRPELTLRDDAFERLRKEVLVARQVSSPHVLRIHDMGRDHDLWFFSMDFVEGEALDRRLGRAGPLPVEDAVRITAQVAEGLAAAHAQGIVHRDLKPSNILLTRDGRALIADFGIARSLRSSGLTEAGAVIGTPDYLSPEQATGKPVDARSDLYALGLLLYEMLSGRLPYGGATPAENFSLRLGGYSEPIEKHRADVPRWVRRLLHQLLRHRPAERMQTATEVIAAIRARRVPLRWRSLRVPAAVGIAVLVLLVTTWTWIAPQLAVSPPKPPPDRVLLQLRVAPGLDWSEDRRVALADLMRDDLGAWFASAVIDTERAEPALGRWQGAAQEPADRAQLQSEIRHRFLLDVVVETADERASLSAALYEAGRGDAPSSFVAAGRDLDEAWSALRTRIATERPELVVDAAAPASLQGAASAAWAEAYGAALRASLLGQIEAAATYLRGTSEASLASRMLDVELALSEGDLSAARRRLQGLSTTDPAGPAQVALLQGRATNDAGAVVGVARAQLARHPAAVHWSWRLADALISLGELEQADGVLDTALVIDDGDPRGWFLRGKAAILRGDMRPAVDDHLVRAVLQNKRDRNRLGEAEALNALGIGYARLGQMADAEEQYRRALALREQLGHLRGEASSLRNLAQILMIRGAHDEASALLERARGHFATLDDRAGLAAVENEIGLLAEERGDYQAALEAYRKAMRSRERLGDRQGVAESQNNIGFAQFQLGDYDSAAVFWRSSIDGFTSIGDALGRIRAAQNLGLLESLRGRWATARKLLDDALAEARQHQLTEEIAVCRRNLAELALLQGNLMDAVAEREGAERLFVEREDLRGRFDSGLLAARIALTAHDPDAAAGALNELAELVPDVSVEQQVWWDLLQADLAEVRDDADAWKAHTARATEGAERAGIRSLQLAAAARSEPLAHDLDREVLAFGDQSILLLWARRALGEPGASSDIYVRALEALGESADLPVSWELHRLGAGHLAREGDATGAAAAVARADAAFEALLQSTPDQLRPALQQAWESPRS